MIASTAVSDTSLPAVDASDADVEPLLTRVEREIKAGRLTLPVMPTVALDVRRLVEADAGIAAVVAVIEKDPSIAAALIKYANSALYAGLRDITDLHQAVTRLGVMPVQQAVTALSARSLFERADKAHVGLYTRIWHHSIVTALAARRLALRVRVPPETAFLAGLLHDLGKVVVLQLLSNARPSSPRVAALDETIVLEFVEALHCSVGDMFFESWNIPVTLRGVLRRHHDTALSASDDMLIAVVQMANAIAHKLGASLCPQTEVSLLDLPACTMLRMDDVKLASLLVDLEDDIAELSAVM